MASDLGTLSGRYVLEEAVAQGGMATVYRARDDVLARTVAIKVLHPHLAEDEAFLERFRVEALAAARLTHPHIVAVYDTGFDDLDGERRHFIVMEFCEGGSLADVLARRGPLPFDEVAAIGVAVCEALSYAHRAGIVHRDVKPANVLIGSDGTLKVADFGIAKAAFAAGDITTTGAILGTVTYLSPEQLRGDEPDARSDLYALGVTLYELVAGRPPFQEESQMATALRHLRDEPPPLRSLRGGVPRRLETAIMRALAKDPDRRYQSASEMAAALSGEAAAPPAAQTRPLRVPARPTATPPGGPQPSATRPLLLVLSLVALAAAAALALTMVARSPQPSTEGGGEGRSGGNGGGELAVREVSGVVELDPAGGGDHPEDAPLAADGDPATAWASSTYYDGLQAIGKPGIGLVFDLGSPVEVSSVRISGCAGCAVEIRAGDRSSTVDPSVYATVASTDSLGTRPLSFEPVRARYWLVFVTEVAGGSGRAEIAEVRFSGPA